MQTEPNGEPRFVSDGGGSGPSGDKDAAKPEPLIPGYYNWDDRFYPRGVSDSGEISVAVNAIAINDIEKHLWEAADQLRANSKLKASEYSVPVLGLIFLRFADARFSYLLDLPYSTLPP